MDETRQIYSGTGERATVNKIRACLQEDGKWLLSRGHNRMNRLPGRNGRPFDFKNIFFKEFKIWHKYFFLTVVIYSYMIVYEKEKLFSKFTAS